MIYKKRLVGSHLYILILEDELAPTADERGSWMDPIVHFVRPELLDDSTTTSHLESISSCSGEKNRRKRRDTLWKLPRFIPTSSKKSDT